MSRRTICEDSATKANAYELQQDGEIRKIVSSETGNLNVVEGREITMAIEKDPHKDTNSLVRV
jgi:hypothetical protein